MDKSNDVINLRFPVSKVVKDEDKGKVDQASFFFLL